MDVEILLDASEADEQQLENITKKFNDWYQEGAEVRPNKLSFGSLTTFESGRRYLVDIGYADLITSIKNLHARLHRLGVKVFIHFLP